MGLFNYFINSYLKYGDNEKKEKGAVILKYKFDFMKPVLLFIAFIFGMGLIGLFESQSYSLNDESFTGFLFCSVLLPLLILFWLLYLSKKKIVFKNETFYVSTLFSKKVVKYSEIIRVKQDKIEGVRVYSNKTNFFINVSLTNYRKIYDKLKNDFLSK